MGQRLKLHKNNNDDDEHPSWKKIRITVTIIYTVVGAVVLLCEILKILILYFDAQR